MTTAYEDYRPSHRFEGVVAANSFHCVDPTVGYYRAADLLADGAPLALLWNLPAAADDAMQRQLNEQLPLGASIDMVDRIHLCVARRSA